MVFYYTMIHQSVELSVGAFMGFTTAFGSFSAAMLELVSAYLQINAVGHLRPNETHSGNAARTAR